MLEGAKKREIKQGNVFADERGKKRNPFYEAQPVGKSIFPGWEDLVGI